MMNITRLKKALEKFALRQAFALDFVKAIEGRIIWQYLELKPGEKVCDVACGSGQLSAKMVRAGCHVEGIDMWERAIQNAKLLCEGGDGHFRVGDAQDLPYPDGYFDKLVSVCALEHFENDELALKEMHRVLKAGSFLVITVDSFTYRGITKNIKDRHKTRAHVVNYYSEAQLKKKLEEAGFTVEKSQYLFRSLLSALLFNQKLECKDLKSALFYYATFPLTYCISVLSDRICGRQNEGYILAVKAVKL
jgi:ubiquinone/menaquinone biosynthesis C-methylase UbiE